MLNVEFGISENQDSRLNELVKTATQVAPTRAGILVTGDRGTGKSSLCRWLHHQSKIAGKPYLSLECGDYKDLPPLFTDLFRRANGGTLVLENIDNASPAFQSALLLAIEMTSTEERPRFIATSRKDLRSLARQELFRQDLYFKLVVVTLEIPCLRDRPKDIVSLADFFLKVNSIIYGNQNARFSSEAIEKLKMWPWPGNIRELENVIERATALAVGDSIEEQSIQFEPEPKVQIIDFSPGMSLSDVEKRLILQTLELTAQNRTKAAQLLGISIRTLRNKLNEYRGENVYEQSI